MWTMFCPDIIIFANADYSRFADDIRVNRDAASKALTEVAERWAREKKTFAEVLHRNYKASGSLANKLWFRAYSAA